MKTITFDSMDDFVEVLEEELSLNKDAFDISWSIDFRDELKDVWTHDCALIPNEIKLLCIQKDEKGKQN